MEYCEDIYSSVAEIERSFCKTALLRNAAITRRKLFLSRYLNLSPLPLLPYPIIYLLASCVDRDGLYSVQLVLSVNLYSLPCLLNLNVGASPWSDIDRHRELLVF